jgi:hypothetical protein
VHGDHLAAHDFFRNIAGPIVFVSGPRPAPNLIRDQSLIEFPGEKTFSRISGPEGAVAVKGGYARFEAEDAIDKVSL